MVEEIFKNVAEELARAMAHYKPFNSAHEGYAAILEELDELWDEVKKKPSKRSKDLMNEEAVQVAAMAIRFVHDVCYSEKDNEVIHADETDKIR